MALEVKCCDIKSHIYDKKIMKKKSNYEIKKSL